MRDIFAAPNGSFNKMNTFDNVTFIFFVTFIYKAHSYFLWIHVCPNIKCGFLSRCVHTVKIVDNALNGTYIII